MSTHASHSLDVTEGVIWKQLVQLAVPIFFSSFFQQAYSLINTYVVGHFSGKVALGGIQATVTLVDLVVGMSVGIGSGCAVIVGQYFGAHDQRRLHDGMQTAIGLGLVVGVCFSVVGLVAIEPLLRAMGTPEELFGEALAYGRVYMGALVLSILYNMGSALQRAVGDTRSPSIIVASTCVVNVIMDLLLVAHLGLGALGCGIATACALGWGAVVTLWRLTHVDESWRLDLRQVRIDRRIARSMLLTGIPLGLESSAYSISNIVIQAAINSFGANAVTGWGLSGRIDSINWLFANAISVSTTTFAAQNFGARRYDRMRKGLHTSVAMAVVIVGLVSFTTVSLAQPLAYFFIDDQTVVGYTVYMIHFTAPFYVIFTAMDNTAGTIRGSGESLRPMIIVMLGTCAFRLVWLPIARHLSASLAAVLACFPVSWLVTLVVMVTYFRHGHWLQHAKEHEDAALRA